MYSQLHSSYLHTAEFKRHLLFISYAFKFLFTFFHILMPLFKPTIAHLKSFTLYLLTLFPFLSVMHRLDISRVSITFTTCKVPFPVWATLLSPLTALPLPSPLAASSTHKAQPSAGLAWLHSFLTKFLLSLPCHLQTCLYLKFYLFCIWFCCNSNTNFSFLFFFFARLLSILCHLPDPLFQS